VVQNEIKDTPADDHLNKLSVTHTSTDFHFFSDTEVTTK
jgi:hypothetical protein